MKIAVITETDPEIYNLGARKIEAKFRQEGHEVTYSYRAGLEIEGADQAFVSAIFTWDLPRLIHDVNLIKSKGIPVEVGGPACTVMQDLIWTNCKVRPHLGVDPRFEFIKGDFQMTFTQRGCPRACEFCLVQFVEGKKMIEYDNFNIPVGDHPMVGDNNILATTRRHQELFVDRLAGVKHLDVNSGFDDRIFVQDPQRYFDLYSKLDLGREGWRFAYDKPEQKEPLKKCIDFLHAQGIDYRHITVFCLVGGPGQEFEDDRQKLQWLVDNGTSPYPQRFRPFDTVFRDVTPKGWKKEQLNQLFDYYAPHGGSVTWKMCSWEEYLANPNHREEAPKEQMKLI